MNPTRRSFENAITALGYTRRTRRFEDGLTGHYGEKSYPHWSAVIPLWDGTRSPSVSAGLFVPLLDQTIGTLFPGLGRTFPIEHRVDQTTRSPTDDPARIGEWIDTAVRRCAATLERVQRPRDLAPFLATRRLREVTPNPDWSYRCPQWIALTYLGKGPDAARAALLEELQFAKRFGSTKLIHAAIDLVFFRRKPRDVYQRAEMFEQALTRLDLLPAALPAFDPADYDYPPIPIERDPSAYY